MTQRGKKRRISNDENKCNNKIARTELTSEKTTTEKYFESKKAGKKTNKKAEQSEEVELKTSGSVSYEIGNEPYRSIQGLVVNEKPDLSAEKVKLIRSVQKCYYDHYRVSIGEEAMRKMQGNGKNAQGKNISSRPDIKALTKTQNEQKHLYHDLHIIGHIPGVKVNDTFHSRSEMKVLGLHWKHQMGIDRLSTNCAKKYQLYWNGRLLQPVCAVVVSGGYKDNSSKDDAYEMQYTGEGGNDFLGNKEQFKDQKLERGNAGMMDSCEIGTPVRVFRKQEDPCSLYGHVYLYDGLWVVRAWDKVVGSGEKGYKVYKFSMVRLPGQAVPLAKSIGFKSLASAPRKLSSLVNYSQHIISSDYSQGLEPVPVTVQNAIDDEVPLGFNMDFVPADIDEKRRKKLEKSMERNNESFVYVTKSVRCENVKEPKQHDIRWLKKQLRKSLSWDERYCIRDEHWMLVLMNNGQLPYNVRKQHILNNGSILPVIYECGEWNTECKQGKLCPYRRTQMGIRARLELFKTKDKGWGVRTLDPIAVGEYVASYLGEIMGIKDSEDVGQEYQFDLAPRSEFSNFLTLCGEEFQQKYIVDAKRYGNVSRFVNHSCDPNLYCQPVVNYHFDETQLEVALFAMKNIDPWDELSIDYGKAYIDVNLEGKCLCGSIFCCGQALFDKVI